MTFLCRSLVLGLCVQDPVDVLSRVNDDYFTGSWSEFFEFIRRLLHGSEDPGVTFEELKPRKESFGEIDIPAGNQEIDLTIIVQLDIPIGDAIPTCVPASATDPMHQYSAGA